MKSALLRRAVILRLKMGIIMTVKIIENAGSCEYLQVLDVSISKTGKVLEKRDEVFEDVL